MSDFLEALNQRVLIFDGAAGTNLQNENLTADDFGGPDLEGCNEILVETRPDVIERLHRSFFEVGCDAVETNTFGSFASVLAEYGIAEKAYDLSATAAQLARGVADEFTTPERRRFVIGSIGPGTKMPSLGHTAFASLRDDYTTQIRGLLDGGVDVLLVETVYDLLQAKAALIAARQAMRDVGRDVPLMVQVTIETTGRMLMGTEIGAALTALEPMKPDVIGMNCATGPDEMAEHLRHLSQQSRTFLSALPNAGMPSIVDGHTHYDLTPSALADAHERFVTEFGLNIVGGCCGTTPEHLKAVVERIGVRAPVERHPVHEPSVASIYSPVTLQQDTSFLVIGERSNTNGSRDFREALLADDLDTCLQIAKDQVKESAHVLDVCVDYVGRDGTVDMANIIERFATQIPIPLVLDSTEPEVMEAGLQLIGGRPILNSANLEEGEEPGTRFDRVMNLARQYGTAVICLAIDEEGQARDVDWKLRTCRRMYDLAQERYGLEPGDLIFDALTFPLGAGTEDLRGDAKATIEAIQRIKTELPGSFTTLGVSNVSFGLKPAARTVLNSVFLNECVKAGLDSAIVHAGRVLPTHKIPEEQLNVCLDLIYDRRRPGYDPLTTLLDLFEDVNLSEAVKEDRSGWTVEQRLEARIVDGDRDGIEDDLDLALQTHDALSIINDVLLAGMKTVGQLFASGDMQLPFVLQSAETMKASVRHLEPHMEQADAGGKGVVVLGTVKGDVHDIGKNLVDIILTNNGYTVHNLGIKVPVGDFIAKTRELDADAVGMSGLLVKSTLIMRDNLEEFNRQGMSDVAVLLGGAALNRTYVEVDMRKVYEGRVFYGKDAFEGLSVMETLRSGDFGDEYGRELGGRKLPQRKSERAGDTAPVEVPARSDVATDNEIFVPPFLGSRVVKGIALDEIAGYVNETALFRNQWQYRPEGGESDAEFKDRIRGTFREVLAEAQRQHVLAPAVAYGYFPANSDGDDLVIWSDGDRRTERMRFRFPRQQKGRFLCIADFFRPVDSGEADYAAFHVVTQGQNITPYEQALFAGDEYARYLLFHGLGVEMAEALAEYWHRRIREEWGFADQDGPSLSGLFKQQYRGGRYSWGYPACPDLDDQVKVADLLDIERIGVKVSEEFELHPEQSTSALICHHPEAKYFIA
ncbi:MAG: methionine synthase [Acidimicrobiia bacterium]|nr:methionine synthase [Acidimicrobiia bacterium]MBP8181043.1 methionine synthase [Acidimicrobiia bacterium]